MPITVIKGFDHSHAFSVYLNSPGGVYRYYPCNERGAFWVYPYLACGSSCTTTQVWSRILVQVTIYRSLLIGQDSHLDQSEAYDIS